MNEEYFSNLVDAVAAELGEETNPWPSEAMKPHLAEMIEGLAPLDYNAEHRKARRENK